MLTEILSRETCAACQCCCVFSGYDIFDTPVLNQEVKDRCEQLLPGIRFLTKGEHAYLFRMQQTDPDTFPCPLLQAESGCMLGKDKPFDCQIYPFQIVCIQQRHAIVLSPLCDAVNAMPVSVLQKQLKQGLAETIFSYARKHPDVIRHYDYDSPVLLWE